MAVSSPSLSLPSSSATLSNNKPSVPRCITPSCSVFSSHNITTSSKGNSSINSSEERTCMRRSLLLGAGALSLGLSPPSLLLADEIPQNYDAFVDKIDGYSYYYPSDWRDFDFIGHDSAFKDRYLQLQNVRVKFIPTNKTDIHDLGPIEEVVYHLLRHVYSAPTQVPTVFDMKERTVDGKNYYTFEYTLTSPNFARSAFATIAIGNGRYYSLIVGANERRWKRVRNQLKVVAESFRVLDI